MKKIKVIFIDNALLFRKRFVLYLNAVATIEVMHDFSSIEELNDCNLNGVDLLLFDTQTDEDYFTLSKIQKKYPKLNMILLSDGQRIFENYLFASTHKVNAFLSKKVSPEIVISTQIWCAPPCAYHLTYTNYNRRTKKPLLFENRAYELKITQPQQNNTQKMSEIKPSVRVPSYCQISSNIKQIRATLRQVQGEQARTSFIERTPILFNARKNKK